jgi:hypothetical protein
MKRQQPNPLPSPLVISLTSYPRRFENLHLTLKCLLSQTIRPDRVILWIAENELHLLPKNVTRLKKRGLEIHVTHDIKSYKKILPTLDLCPDAYIATADDDLYYPPDWLKDLVEGTGEAVIACHRAHEITFFQTGGFRPYAEWNVDIKKRGIYPMIFPTAGAGALYPPGILSHSAMERQMGLELCPHGDDIWLYWIGTRNGAKYRTVGEWRMLVEWPGSQGEALWFENVRGRNDEQIRKMVDYFGYPTKLPETP